MGAIAGEHVRHLSLSVGTATRYNLPVTERQANVTKFKDRHFYVIIICNIHLGLKLKEKYCHTLAGMENSSSPEALHMHIWSAIKGSAKRKLGKIHIKNTLYWL